MMEIEIIKKPIQLESLKTMAREGFGNLVKAVVDIEKGVMAVGGGMHADEEVLLIEKEGSSREHTWGINIYPDKAVDEWIEFDSMVNLKPGFGNTTRNVDNPEIQEKIKGAVKKLITT